MMEAHVRNAAVNMKLPLREVEHVEVRNTIRYLTAINKTAKEIHDEIQRVYEVGCMNVQNVWKWRREFIAGKGQLYDKL